MNYSLKNYDELLESTFKKKKINFVVEQSKTVFSNKNAPDSWIEVIPNHISDNELKEIIISGSKDLGHRLLVLMFIVRMKEGKVYFRKYNDSNIEVKIDW